MSEFKFKILVKDKKSSARVGIITTTHGLIRTPGFVPVATAASIKALTPDEFQASDLDVFFVNTYHMLFRPEIETVGKLGGIHKFMNWNGPIMTDSGGFQAFSLGEFGPRQKNDKKDNLVKITDEGIYFKSAWDGSLKFLGPKESIIAQQKLGSDIMMAFDECTFYPITKFRAAKAMLRTHVWAKDCLAQNKKVRKNQALYGIVQGSVFKDLREESGRYFSKLDFEGYAIGSVANSKEPRSKVFSVLDWTLPFLLDTQKPIHFLGVGEIEDMFMAIEKGIDTFDCVIPTRLGRMGWIFCKTCGLKNKFRYDITKSNFRLDKNKLSKDCQCFTCINFTRAYINHLFRCHELLAYRLATIHNLFFFGSLMGEIRENISAGTFSKFRNRFLRR